MLIKSAADESSIAFEAPKAWEESPETYIPYVSMSSSRADEMIRVAISPLQFGQRRKKSISKTCEPIGYEKTLDRSLFRSRHFVCSGSDNVGEWMTRAAESSGRETMRSFEELDSFNPGFDVSAK